MEIYELANEYLRLKEEQERLQNRIKQIKEILQKEIAEKGNFRVGDREFVLIRRVSFDFDPDKVREIEGDSIFNVVARTVVDKKKIFSLQKAGIIGSEIERAKVIRKETSALVVKEVSKK